VLSRVPGISFREVLDPAGDSATFISWFMPTAEEADRLAGMLAEQGAAPIPWGKNTWHAYPHWEHLHAASTAVKSGWPFKRPDGDVSYGAGDLPQTAGILSRCLSWQIMLGWDEAKLEQMTQAINHAVSNW